MSEKPQPEESLAEEFRSLGKNLVSALQAAWDAPERKRLQEEVMNGLNELGETLQREGEHFTNSPTGQQLKTNVEQIGERIRSSETQEKVRIELLGALKTANSEIQKVIDRWTRTESEVGETPPSETETSQEGPEN